MPDSVLFRVQQVEINIRDEDMPGPTRYKAACSCCGQVVRDRREVVNNVTVLCKPCAEEAYFSNAKEITWPDMNRIPGNNGQHSNSRHHFPKSNSGGDKAHP